MNETITPFADALILAAGQGTRMPSPRHKLMQTLLGESMISLVYRALAATPELDRLITVVGHKAEQLEAELQTWSAALGREFLRVEQTEQRGTGHAVISSMPLLEGGRGHVLVVNGDSPLLDPELLRFFLAEARESDVAFLSVRLDDPAAYGRVVRRDGKVTAIVEAEDYDPDVYGPPTGEINTGVWLLRLETLRLLLPLLNTDNKKGEYYLTDLVGLALQRDLKVTGVKAAGSRRDAPGQAAGLSASLLGVNNPRELAHAEEILRARIVDALLDKGVILHFPQSVRVSPLAIIEPGAELFGPCEVYGSSRIAFGARVESHCVLKNANVAAGAEIRPYSHLEGATVGEGCLVGPYARMRPGAVMERNSHLGNFVEMKKSRLGEGAKANHLTYLGDADVGPGTNIGAGTITCNYDGKNKFKTIIGAGAFVGSNTAFVAPVTVGDGALVGAGSVITRDVPENTLAVSRAKQAGRPLARDKKRKGTV